MPPCHHLGSLSLSHILFDHKAYLLFLGKSASALLHLFYRHCSNSVGHNLLRNRYKKLVLTNMLRALLHIKWVPQQLAGSCTGSVAYKLLSLKPYL